MFCLRAINCPGAIIQQKAGKPAVRPLMPCLAAWLPGCLLTKEASLSPPPLPPFILGPYSPGMLCASCHATYVPYIRLIAVMIGLDGNIYGRQHLCTAVQTWGPTIGRRVLSSAPYISPPEHATRLRFSVLVKKSKESSGPRTRKVKEKQSRFQVERYSLHTYQSWNPRRKRAFVGRSGELHTNIALRVECCRTCRKIEALVLYLVFVHRLALGIGHRLDCCCCFEQPLNLLKGTEIFEPFFSL